MRRSMAFSWRSCCSISRDMFRFKSGLSTTPRTKENASGKSSSLASVISTDEL